MTANTEKIVLIIDDNVDFHTLAEALLTRNGYRIRSLFDAKIREVQDASRFCDLIILDVDLPTAKGTDISIQLKGAEPTSHIPIIMVTGDPDGEEACMKAKADACLIKPFSAGVLLEKIRQVLPS
jgi:two-component system, OmpR family, phosphate regulon response regulator PhoB